MPLYKYVCPERIDILENDMIRFTQPMYLNDYFDIKIAVKKTLSPEILSNNMAIQDMRNAIEKRIDKSKFPFNKWENKDLEPMLFDYIIQNLGEPDIESKLILERVPNKHFGVFCLTTDPDNKIMWAHYGQQNKGLVLMFDEMHPYFNDNHFQVPDFFPLQKVQYSSVPNMADHIYDNNLPLSFYTKDTVWSYEREWRIIFPIGKADKTIEANGEIIKLFKFPPEIITGVIFGLRTEESTINKIKGLCAEDKYKHVKLYQIKAIEDSYELKVEDYK